MSETWPREIGGNRVRTNDPYALTEHIRHLVKNGQDFTSFQQMLESLLQVRTGCLHADWHVYEEFVSLLRLYRDALDTGSVHCTDLKKSVESFDRHLRNNPPAS